MSKDEALKLALEALEVANSCVDGYYIPKGKTHLPEIEKAIIAIKEALANSEKKLAGEGILIGWDTKTDTPIFAPKPQRTWVRLTDDDKLAIEIEAAENDFTDLGVILATEAKLKEKNT